MSSQGKLREIDAMVFSMDSTTAPEKFIDVVHVEKNIRRNAVELFFIRDGLKSGQSQLLQGVFELAPLQESDLRQSVSPTLRLPYDVASLLMTSLWAAGFRPEGVNDTMTQAAVGEHLKTVQASLDIERGRVDKLVDAVLSVNKDLIGNTK